MYVRLLVSFVVYLVVVRPSSAFVILADPIAIRPANMADVNQVTLAKYKGGRLVAPRNQADEYVCIEEVDYDHFPVFNIPCSTTGNVNEVVSNEARFNMNLFLANSNLLAAFYIHYRYFRVRSVEVSYKTTDVQASYDRFHKVIYWIPDHWAYDNGHDTPINTWADAVEKSNVSPINAPRNGMFKLKYVPQLVKQDDNLEDEEEPEPGPAQVVWQVRGDCPAGWMVTNDFNRTVDFRGPLVVFNKPYQPNGSPARNAAAYVISVKIVVEFKKAKTGN